LVLLTRSRKFWTPGARGDEGRQRRQVIDEIEQRADADFDPVDGWSDDFPFDEDESEDDQ
jgi:hypothetical protein